MWFGNRVNGLGGAVPSIDVADCVVLLSTFYHPAASCGKASGLPGEHDSQLGAGIGETRLKATQGKVQVCAQISGEGEIGLG